MEKKDIFRHPGLYKSLYNWSSYFHRLYYRKFTVVGKENIPDNVPILFSCNHQNALLDALAVLFASKNPVAFLARADIFRKKFIASLLDFIKMTPVYRLRDGYENMAMNQEVFKKTVRILKSGTPICIFSEGNHLGQKRLRPLKKGVCRIAFQAEESTSFKLNLHIVPVGLDYSNYFNAGSDLLVVFGKPIKVSDYSGQYIENPQKAINSLRDAIAEGMRNLIIHIPEENYHLIADIAAMYEPNVWETRNVKRHPYNKLVIRQYIVQKTVEAFQANPDAAVQIESKLTSFQEKLKIFGLKDCLLQEKSPGTGKLMIEALLTILLSPIHLLGMILNYLPYKIPVWISAKVKDPHFRSSYHFGISLFLFQLYYLIIIASFCLITQDLLLTLLFICTLPVTGLFAFYNYKHSKKLTGKLRLAWLKCYRKQEYEMLAGERVSIIDSIKSIVSVQAEKP